MDAFACVYVYIYIQLLYCSCCHYGIIKHDDDMDIMGQENNSNFKIQESGRPPFWKWKIALYPSM